MKDQSQSPQPVTLCLGKGYGYRFYYNHTNEVRTDPMTGEEQTVYLADFVEVAELTKEAVVVALVRTRYSINDETALHRKKIADEATAGAEFIAYNQFVNECKAIYNTSIV